MPYNRGDIILLDHGQDGAYTMRNNWAKGENLSSENRGEFLCENFYILPTATKPSNDIIVKL